jgi:nucleoside-diphosphate-sugar epimerase
MNSVLLTGVTSFVGRHLAKNLAQSGIRVVATYRTAKRSLIEALAADSPNLELVQLDISDESGFDKLPRSIDAIVHVAGVSVMPGISIDDMLAVNVTGVRNVQRYAMRARASKFIYTSSLSIHGQITAAVVNEHTPINAPDTYGATKYLGERLLAEVADTMPTIAIRLPGVLGSGAHRAWIPTLVEKLVASNDVSIYSPNAKFNNATHVSDLSRFIIQILFNHDWRGFSAFPVGAAESMTILEIASLLHDKLGSGSILRESNLVKPSFTIDSSFASSHFGYVPSRIDAMIVQYLDDYMSGSRSI